jgi:hypothetical protein
LFGRLFPIFFTRKTKAGLSLHFFCTNLALGLGERGIERGRRREREKEEEKERRRSARMKERVFVCLQKKVRNENKCRRRIKFVILQNNILLSSIF